MEELIQKAMGGAGSEERPEQTALPPRSISTSPPPELTQEASDIPLENTLAPREPETVRPVQVPPELIGASLSDYEQLEVLGRGGMGVVLLARQRHTGELLALKQVRPGTDVRRFLHEASAVASLSHPAIVNFLHVVQGEEPGELALAFEYIAGPNLETLVREKGALELADALKTARRVGEALAYAHSQGVIHRDVKPGNVLMDENGPRLTDFGLATGPDLQSLCESQGILGTLDYMAPEQRSCSDKLDARADVYGLGATLYRLLTGSSPRVIREGRLPPQARELVLRCVEDLPEDRPASMDALVEELDRAIERVRRDESGVQAALTQIADDYQRQLEKTSQSGRINRLAVAAAGLSRMDLLPSDFARRLTTRLQLGEPWEDELQRLVGLVLEEAGSPAVLADAYAVLAAALAGVSLSPAAKRSLRKLQRASRTPARPALGTRLAGAVELLTSRGALPTDLLPHLARQAAALPAAQTLERILDHLRAGAYTLADGDWPTHAKRWRRSLEELQATLPEREFRVRLERELLSLELENSARERARERSDTA